jgi:hypothetical protein
MSSSLKSKVSAGPAAQTPDAGQPRSDSGVEVELKGWKTGLNKVALTRAFQEGGMRLSEASSLTGRVLDGETVRVRLGQFNSVEGAARALSEIGVAAITATPQAGRLDRAAI